jgi:hypothetical protein
VFTDCEITVNDHANALAGRHDGLVIALALSCRIERSAGIAASHNYVSRKPLE